MDLWVWLTVLFLSSWWLKYNLKWVSIFCSVSCDAEGDMVKLRKSASHGYIKVYEVVVTSLGKGQE